MGLVFWLTVLKSNNYQSKVRKLTMLYKGLLTSCRPLKPKRGWCLDKEMKTQWSYISYLSLYCVVLGFLQTRILQNIFIWLEVFFQNSLRKLDQRDSHASWLYWRISVIILFFHISRKLKFYFVRKANYLIRCESTA